MTDAASPSHSTPPDSPLAPGTLGQRPSRKRFRLGLLLAANALALVWLWQVVTPAEAVADEASHPNATADGSATQSATTLTAPAPVERELLAADERERFASKTRAYAHAALAKANEKTRGKVGPGNATVAIFARPLGGSAHDGFGLDADTPLAPASNMKLVTTAAALALLGPEWGFETRAEATGPIAEGVLAGDLVLRAAGDPLYDRESNERGGDGSVGRLLEPFCAELLAAGVREIRGDVVLDEGTFAPPAPGPAWPSSNEHWQEHCALAAGFTVNRGCITVTVAPGAVGGPARVAIEPAGLDLATEVNVDTRSGGKLEVHFEARNGKLSVRGHVPARATEWSDSCTHPDPPALFGAVLVHELARHGITVRGGVRRERGARGGPTVARIVSPLARYLAAINTDSNNACADQVFLATGLAVRGAATRAAGAEATALALRTLGVSTEGLIQVDGSGLSRDDRISARQLVALVEAVLARDEHTAALFRDSLAVAGESGTLDGRLREVRGRVQAKTGFIGGVSALSGVANGHDGRTYVFSILVEYPRFDGLNTTVWKPMQDDFCKLLVGAGS